MAEIRAYYFGTMTVMAIIFLRGGMRDSLQAHRKEALGVGFSLMTFFGSARIYSYIVDGPPELPYSYILWAAEWVVACISLGFLRLENDKLEGKLE